MRLTCKSLMSLQHAEQCCMQQQAFLGFQPLLGPAVAGTASGKVANSLTKKKLMSLQHKFADWLHICGIAIWIVHNKASLVF